MCVKRFDLNSAKFLSNSGLAWQAALKKTTVKFDLSTNIDMLLIVEKGISRGICHSIYDMQKLKTNTWKIMIKVKNFHILNIGMYKLSVNNFE